MVLSSDYRTTSCFLPEEEKNGCVRYEVLQKNGKKSNGWKGLKENGKRLT